MNAAEGFLSHLIELRSRMVWALGTVLVVFLILAFGWPTSQKLYAWFAAPMLKALPVGGQMIATDVVGVFLVPLKVTAFAAFILSLPMVLYQAWAFVAPGLYVHEKKLVLPLIITSFALFLVGMGFAYRLVFPTVFGFMSSIAPEGVAWMTDIDKYFSFALTTFMAFGITFEVPIVVIVLVRVGIVSIQALTSARPYVVVGAFIIGAIFTPPDIVSQFMLALPLCVLYELGILMARVTGGPVKQSELVGGSEAD